MSERPPRILHVDDDEANRYAVTRSLVKAGFDVTEAADGAGALRAAAARPDLVILDVRLPDIDGFEVCRRLKADPATADIPVLHLSASFISGGDKAHGLDGGAEAYLVRPVEPVELVATVRALLRGRAAEDALRASEARHRGVLAALGEGVLLLDAGGAIVMANAAAERILGLPLDQMRGRDSSDPRWRPVAEDGSPLPAPAHPPQVALREGRTVTDFVMGVHRPDGTLVWTSITAVPLTDDRTGRVSGVVASFADVTDRRRADAEREQLLASERAARADAEHAGRMKDEFLATLSHELRTPLNAILGWAQIIRGGGAEPDDVAQGIEVIERNARAQSQIIEDLLDMSRIISGKVRLDVGPVDVAAVAAAAVDTARPTATAKGVALTIAGDPSAVVGGDAGRLQQVLWNLLSNAVKFTPKGGSVTVHVDRTPAHVTVAVADTGDGIGPDFLPFVFDRFRQADASSARRHGGLGLGLSIVKQLVELHGGTVAAASDGPGRGTTVTVTLPLTPPSAAADDPPQPAPVAAPAVAAADVAGLRVLVVDDEPDARRLVARLLADRGATVTLAASAEQALARLADAGPFDVLLSDIGMPGQDGHALLRRARELSHAVPAVALTAYARPGDRAAALAAGFTAHVAKPVDPAQLTAALAAAAGR